MDLIAKKSLKFGGKRLQAGDTFTASSREGKALKALGLAAMVPASPRQVSAPETPAKRPRGRPRKTAPTYDRKDMTAAPPIDPPEVDYDEKYGDPFGWPRTRADEE